MFDYGFNFHLPDTGLLKDGDLHSFLLCLVVVRITLIGLMFRSYYIFTFTDYMFNTTLNLHFCHLCFIICKITFTRRMFDRDGDLH